MILTGIVYKATTHRMNELKVDYLVQNIKGDYGAVRNIIEYLLRESGEWDFTISKVYNIE